MRRILPVRRLITLLALVTILTWPAPGHSQTPALVSGAVLDVDGQPVGGATITFEYQGGLTRQLEAVSDDDGRYRQVGLQWGPYRITAAKEGVGRRTAEITLRVGQQLEFDITLVSEEVRALAELSAEELAELERGVAMKPVLDAAVAAREAGNYDEAIARFEEALASVSDCHECHHGLGLVHADQADYDSAEAAFNRSLEVNPQYAPAYQGLASIYNAQRRFDDAAEANQRAAELSAAGTAGDADSDAVFNQGLINWNAGNVVEAKAQFEQTLELDPNHGEAHYWMAMASLNEGNLAGAKTGFERYVELEPDGRFADQARGMITQLP